MAPSGRGTRRKPGRPPLKVYPRGRQARHLRLATPKQAAEDSPGPTVSEADKGQASQSAAPDGSQLTHEELRFMALNRLPTGVPPLTVHSNNHFSKPLLLDTMLRKPPEWQLVEQVSTELMPNWFDAQVGLLSVIITLLLTSLLYCYHRKMIIVHTGLRNHGQQNSSGLAIQETPLWTSELVVV